MRISAISNNLGIFSVNAVKSNNLNLQKTTPLKNDSFERTTDNNYAQV